jgi:iron complex outermembrane receptor protein
MMSVMGNEQEVRAQGVSALVEWNVNPDLTFKSITAQRKDKSWAPIDFDSLPVPTWKCRPCTRTSSSARNST